MLSSPSCTSGARHNAGMDQFDMPADGATRLADTGDIEVFDGVSWQAVAPLSADPTLGHRTGGDGPVVIPRRPLLADAPPPVAEGDESG